MNLKILETNRIISSDPQYYFKDSDYKDYRSLACYERPVCFILHYYFGFSLSRLLLFDRFSFKLDQDENFIHTTNALESFFINNEIVTEQLINLENESFKDYLASTISPNSVVTVPYEIKIGESTIVTSLLIEGIKNDTLICTSLRGDNFFIRKQFPLYLIQKQLYITGKTLSVNRIKITSFIQELVDLSPIELWNRFDLIDKVRYAFQLYYLSINTTNNQGFWCLQKFQNKKFDDWKTYTYKVSEGFSNVLLAQIFWPMLFAYSPFIVFLKYAHNTNLVGNNIFWRNRDSIKHKFEEFERLEQIITNLGLLFGQVPCEERFVRFQKSIVRLCSYYKILESEFVEVFNDFANY